MTIKDLIEQCRKRYACGEAIKWLEGLDPNAPAESAWLACERGDWIWWILTEVGLGKVPAARKAGYRAADRAVRIYTPQTLRRVGLVDEAVKLERLRAVRGPKTAETAARAAGAGAAGAGEAGAGEAAGAISWAAAAAAGASHGSVGQAAWDAAWASAYAWASRDAERKLQAQDLRELVEWKRIEKILAKVDFS